MKPVWIPSGCSVPYISDFNNFSDFGYIFMENSEFRLSIIHRMGNSSFLDQTRPPVCACALLVFLVVFVCSLFFHAGRLSEDSSEQVLIVLDSILLLKWMPI